MAVFAVGFSTSSDSAVADDAPPAVHWSFRPVTRPAPPLVKNANLVESPVDAFILEKIETARQSPGVAADKRTLIRRASYDLIGLPPTSAEVAAFVADQSPDAFVTVVERLLASPHYGERWGRYWLDVARYANTRGDTGTDDNTNPFAFTYRDYVVRALNQDLPYDQFLTEQIAADQLEHAENSPTLAALGFITVGRHFRSNVHDTLDDRIDVVTRGTMALTVSCARCHDHKYDPIPTRDYYSLYGVFASSNEPALLPAINTADAPTVADYQAQRQKLESEKAELIRQHEAGVFERHRQLTAEFLLASRHRDRGRSMGNEGDPVELAIRRAGSRRWRKALEGLKPDSDPIFSPWFAFAALSDAEFVEKGRDLAAKVASNGLPQRVNPVVAQTFAGEPPASLKDVAERYARLLNDLAAQPQPNPDADRETLRLALLTNVAPGNIPTTALTEFLPQPVQEQMRRINADLGRLDADHSGAPQRAMALFDNPQPQNARVFIRGNPNNPGDEVPRQFLNVLSGQNRQPFAHGSGRLELARAITSKDNPLTARMHHFGEGLVTTPDDFGLRSSAPVHGPLLDYLASRFMDEGWSLKKLHRLIMLSRVYKQVSDDGLVSESTDAENRLLSKMNRRRLDFEAMRDTLLFVAGDLDHTVGGRAVPLVAQPPVSAAGIFSGPAKEQPPTLRRAVYAFIDRQNLPGLLRIFDFANPDTSTGRRYVTTVPQQALFFFNNQFVMQRAHSLVSNTEFQKLDTPLKRIQYLYQQVYQRDPEPDEIDMAAQYVASTQGTRAANGWELYAHVLLMSDELLFVD
jgi:hypothetical protein